jgi:hypothetical protein
MNISKRTKLSLSELIELLGEKVVNSLIEKHDISFKNEYDELLPINEVILYAESTASLFEEIIRRKDDFRYGVSPKYRFDVRWRELELCLLLDGYRIEGNMLGSIEPVIEASSTIEDDLTKELQLVALDESEEIIKHINHSAQCFLNAEPDYNGCLSHARIALETLVRSIAKNRGFQLNDNEESKKAWGTSLAYLNSIGFLTKSQEEAISSVYTVVSKGAHVPLGFTEEEYTRFGRNLVTSICYFISKLLTGNKI